MLADVGPVTDGAVLLRSEEVLRRVPRLITDSKPPSLVVDGDVYIAFLLGT